jgi:thioredoxin-related protein
MALMEMNKVKVPGKNKEHKVLVYALSTCAWCKMLKQFLKENNVELRKVLIMVDDGVEDAEFLYPYYRFQEEGY